MVPHRRQRATPRSQRVIGSCEACRRACKAIVQNSIRGPCRLSQNGPFCTVFTQNDHFDPFAPNFYTLRDKIFRMFFPFTSACDPYEAWKVSWKFGNQTHTQTDRCGNFIYGRHYHEQFNILDCRCGFLSVSTEASKIWSCKVHCSINQYWLNPTRTHTEAITQYYNYTRPYFTTIATHTPLYPLHLTYFCASCSQ